MNMIFSFFLPLPSLSQKLLYIKKKTIDNTVMYFLPDTPRISNKKIGTNRDLHQIKHLNFILVH